MEQGAIDALDKFVPSRKNMPDLQGNPLNRGLTSDAKAKVNEPPQPHLSYLCEALSAFQTLIILSENLVGRFRSEERAGGFPFSSILSPADVPPERRRLPCRDDPHSFLLLRSVHTFPKLCPVWLYCSHIK